MSGINLPPGVSTTDVDEAAGVARNTIHRMRGPVMPMKGQGGPLFPQSRPLPNGGHMHLVGASVRDYFIAHAPAEVPEWFFPTMDRECPAVPSMDHIEDSELRKAVKDHYYSDLGTEDAEGQVREWLVARDALQKAQEQWQADFRRECDLQWPLAWADEMLKRRGA